MADLSGLTANFFPTPKEGFTTTTGGTVDSSTDTEIPLNSVSGLNNGDVFTGLIDPGNAKERAFTGVVDTGGSQITNVVFTTGSNATHTAGATVVDYVTSTHVAQMTKGILKHSDQNGDILADNTATFSSNIDVNDASTAIRDSSDNELVKFVKTASAVNEITVTNNSTGNSPSISATGGDTNVGLTLATKADGLLRLGGMRVQNDTTNSTGTGLVIQHGWGWVIGPAAANSTTESITFPTAFSSAPIVILGKLGDRSGSDPSAIGDLTTTSGAYAEAEDITTSGFVAGILSRDAGSNLSNTVRYGYSWIAIGVV